MQDSVAHETEEEATDSDLDHVLLFDVVKFLIVRNCEIGMELYQVWLG